MSVSPYDIILRPVMTEKSYDNLDARKYTFIVARHANKHQIRWAAEQIFGVTVQKVNVMTRKGKEKRMGKFSGMLPTTKRAIIKVTTSSKTIEFFDGMA